MKFRMRLSGLVKFRVICEIVFKSPVLTKSLQTQKEGIKEPKSEYSYYGPTRHLEKRTKNASWKNFVISRIAVQFS